ncbi:hypothetical protein CSOJ01_16038 [Colletotrichum sojae]|uniref:Uncharacterized protein n=1 Tax=Colletotrichum sojae TaxID=2175907 RepID=A0A8H6MHX0_9PEZI|nr:hypothetical protein CSOJ01_16038 [Colletotrichum sojae]
MSSVRTSKKIYARHVNFEGVQSLAYLTNEASDDRDMLLFDPTSPITIDTLYIANDALGIRRLLFADSSQPCTVEKEVNVWWRKAKLRRFGGLIRCNSDPPDLALLLLLLAMDAYDEALSLWDDPIDLPPNLVNEKEQAKRLFLEYESTTLPDRAEVREKTNSQRQSVMEKWEMFARDYLEIDPDQVWYDLCDEKESAANPIQSFLESYARQSMERRICLGPKEYEWTPTVKTAVTMMEVWKNLLSCADATVLQTKRRQDQENKTRWRLAFTEGEAKGKRRGNDLVYRISVVSLPIASGIHF